MRKESDSDVDGRRYVLLCSDLGSADSFLTSYRAVAEAEVDHEVLLCGRKIAPPADLWLMLMECFQKDCWFANEEEDL